MRGFLKSSGRWLSAGWYWPLVLLALPACAFQTNGIAVPGAFDPGDQPLTSAVMCDIPKPQDSGKSYRCATATDVGVGLLDTTAAVSLADGTHQNLVLDQSVEATNECGPLGRVTEYIDPFPTGTPVCLNCMQQIPAKYKGPDDVCAAKCVELLDDEEMEPTGGSVAYCNANAHASTNFKPNVCFTNACSNGGTPVMPFDDPRKNAEPVNWTDLNGTTAWDVSQDVASPDSNSLKRTAATTGMGTQDFNAGGASKQFITHGDAWVEFSAHENGVGHVLGVRQSACADDTCPDTNYGLDNIGFSIDLNTDDNIYVIESGPSGMSTASLGTYLPTDRFRIHITDNHDGTASITYKKITGPCVPGGNCTETQIDPNVSKGAKYPLRIVSSFREQGAILENVVVMRIKDSK